MKIEVNKDIHNAGTPKKFPKYEKSPSTVEIQFKTAENIVTLLRVQLMNGKFSKENKAKLEALMNQVLQDTVVASEKVNNPKFQGGDNKKGFLDAVKHTREHFVTSIVSQEWNTQMRTSAESLLVMYDQMRDKLEKL